MERDQRMTIEDIFNSITERIRTTASVKVVYGDPVQTEGKTIIPVARVKYGFGAGGGSQEAAPPSGNPGSPGQAMGGGGGGGVSVSPVGIIEITPGETRFISFEDRQRIIKALLIGTLVGVFLLRRRRRS